MVDQRRTPVLLKPALAGATGAVTTQCLTMLGRLPDNCNSRPAAVKPHLDAIPNYATLTFHRPNHSGQKAETEFNHKDTKSLRVRREAPAEHADSRPGETRIQNHGSGEINPG